MTMDNDMLRRAKSIITRKAQEFILNGKNEQRGMVDYLNDCSGDYEVNYTDFLEYTGKIGVAIPSCGGFVFDDAVDEYMNEFLVSEYFDIMADNKATDIMTMGSKEPKTYSELGKTNAKII